MPTYTRLYEVVTEADSEEEAIENFEEDGPECGPKCSEAVTVSPYIAEEQVLIAEALAVLAAHDRNRAAQPTHPQAEKAYRRIMSRAVAADALRERILDANRV